MEDPSCKAVSPSIRTSLSSSRIHYRSEKTSKIRNNIMNLTPPWSRKSSRKSPMAARRRGLSRQKRNRSLRARWTVRKRNEWIVRNASLSNATWIA